MTCRVYIPFPVNLYRYNKCNKTKYKKQTGINTKALKKNDIDFLLASTAISQGAILVSNDGVFGDIVDYEVGLEFEVWV